MPPYRVDEATCASFSYGNGPASREKSATMSPARAKLPGMLARCDGLVQTDCRTHPGSSPDPHAVSPSSTTANGATPMTITAV